MDDDKLPTGVIDKLSDDPQAKREQTFDVMSHDEMSALCKRDPELFESVTRIAIEQACQASTPEETLRYKRFQWSIDMHLAKGKTPLRRMQLMEELFYEKVYGGNGLLLQLSASCAEIGRLLKTGNSLPTEDTPVQLEREFEVTPPAPHKPICKVINLPHKD